MLELKTNFLLTVLASLKVRFKVNILGTDRLQKCGICNDIVVFMASHPPEKHP